MNQIKVLIISPNLMLREGILSMFGSHPEYEVSCIAGEKETNLQQTCRFAPHVLLLDINLNFSNSKFLIELLRKQLPGVKIAVFGVTAGEQKLLEFVKEGIAGFLLSDASFEVFKETVRLIAQGFTVLPPSLNASLFQQIERHAVVDGKVNLTGSIRITQREGEIIQLIKAGFTNKEIAAELSIATYTVKSHIHHILEKLSLHSRTQIATGVKTKEPIKIEPN
jgi:DNA-binding NarL/FixJ family response regulator